jgi:hypothetical protein
MSINDKDANANQTQNTGASSNTQANFQQNILSGSFANLKNNLHFGNVRGQQQNVTQFVYSAVKEIANAKGLNLEVALEILDNTVVQVGLSAIVFSHKHGNNVYFSTLLIEGSETTTLKPIKVQFQGRDFTELARPATDFYDATTTHAIIDSLRTTYPGSAVEIIDVGANVISRVVTIGKSVADLVKSTEMDLYVFYAINNILAAKLDDTNEATFNVSVAVSDRNARVRAQIDKNPAPIVSASGLPIRSDVSITISATTGDSLNGAKFVSSDDITVINGYMDLSYIDARVAAALQSQITGVAVDPSSITQTYMPRFVMTRVDSLLPVYNAEFSLLAIASSLAMSRDNAWMDLFKPRYGRKPGLDLTDVGALGFEAVHLTEDGQAARIDVKSDDFSGNINNLVEYLSTSMFTAINYSMDIVECSDTGGIDSLYLAAATGVPSAIDAVIRHADQLTGGRFSEIWEGGAIATYNNVIVPMGYYEDKDGVLRDLRTYDYLAMLNKWGETDINLVQKFSEAFDKINEDPYYRLSVLKDLLVNTIGSSVNVTSFAHRIDWDPTFLTTLVTAIANAGFIVESNSIGAYSANVNRRGNAAALQQGVKYNNGVTNFMTYSGNSGHSGGFNAAQRFNPYQGR